MHNILKRIHKGWLLKRLNKLPDLATTAQVKSTLKISMIVLQRWLADPYLRHNTIAEKTGTRWYWHKAKLRLWLVAVFKLDIPVSLAMASNPGDGDDTQEPEYIKIRRRLGMPLNYSVSQHREL